MIQAGTILKVCDKTGVILVQCVKVFGSSKRRIAVLGDVVLVSVKRINPKKFQNVKLFRRKKFFKGTLHRGLIVRTKVNFLRLPGLFLRFNENSVVLVIKGAFLFLIESMVRFHVNYVWRCHLWGVLLD